jgi:hypothetical protein
MPTILNHSPSKLLNNCWSSDADASLVGSSPLDDPRAWSFVMKWAKGSIEFPQLINSMTETFGDQYIADEWKKLYDSIFLLADPGEDIDDCYRPT